MSMPSLRSNGFCFELVYRVIFGANSPSEPLLRRREIWGWRRPRSAGRLAWTFLLDAHAYASARQGVTFLPPMSMVSLRPFVSFCLFLRAKTWTYYGHQINHQEQESDDSCPLPFWQLDTFGQIDPF